MERLHGLGVMSRMPRASTCPGNEGAAGWQSPAGDTQSCLWQGMVALVAARGHPELPLGMASTVVPWGRLCWAGGLPRLCHSAVPGCVPLCPLSPSVHQSSLGVLVLLLLRDLGSGTGGQCSLLCLQLG